ncbi:MAG: hypothetical protein C4306_06105 [Thermoleophilia bacterium]|mgnify:FL=1
MPTRIITRPALARALLDQQGLALERERGLGSGLFSNLERRSVGRLGQTGPAFVCEQALGEPRPERAPSAVEKEASADLRGAADEVSAVSLTCSVLASRLAEIEAKLAFLQEQVERLLALEQR